MKHLYIMNLSAKAQEYLDLAGKETNPYIVCTYVSKAEALLEDAVEVIKNTYNTTEENEELS